jgi:hypothetical protein
MKDTDMIRGKGVSRIGEKVLTYFMDGLLGALALAAA